MATSPKPQDYVALEMWGKSYLTPPEVIEAQQARAARDGAPVDAIRRHNGKWVRVTSLPADDPMRLKYEKLMARRADPRYRR